VRLVLRLLLATLIGFGLFAVLAVFQVRALGIDPETAVTVVAFGGLIVGGLWTIKIGRDAEKV